MAIMYVYLLDKEFHRPELIGEAAREDTLGNVIEQSAGLDRERVSSEPFPADRHENASGPP